MTMQSKGILETFSYEVPRACYDGYYFLGNCGGNNQAAEARNISITFLGEGVLIGSTPG
jgi:hypothetical protein